MSLGKSVDQAAWLETNPLNPTSFEEYNAWIAAGNRAAPVPIHGGGPTNPGRIEGFPGETVLEESPMSFLTNPITLPVVGDVPLWMALIGGYFVYKQVFSDDGRKRR